MGSGWVQRALFPLAAPAPRKYARCKRCGHKAHTAACTAPGPITCRPVPFGNGNGALVRGRWPCDCIYRTAAGSDE